MNNKFGHFTEQESWNEDKPISFEELDRELQTGKINLETFLTFNKRYMENYNMVHDEVVKTWEDDGKEHGAAFSYMLKEAPLEIQKKFEEIQKTERYIWSPEVVDKVESPSEELINLANEYIYAGWADNGSEDSKWDKFCKAGGNLALFNLLKKKELLDKRYL